MAEFIFFKDEDCKGDEVGTLDALYQRDMDLTDESKWDNDKIKSVSFSDIPAGTILELWDDSSKRHNDDWIRVTFNAKKSGKINNIEENPNLSDVTYKKTGSGNLTGKVSHIVMMPGGALADSYLAIDGIYEWDEKDGDAHEFTSSDSNYRLWKPTVDSWGDGIKLNFKMDHIRGLAADDHAALCMSFDENGILKEYTCTTEIAGENPIVQILDVATEAADELAEVLEDSSKTASLVTSICTSASASLIKIIEEMNETGGRLMFPSVIDGKAADMGTAIAKALAN